MKHDETNLNVLKQRISPKLALEKCIDDLKDRGREVFSDLYPDEKEILAACIIKTMEPDKAYEYVSEAAFNDEFIVRLLDAIAKSSDEAAINNFNIAKKDITKYAEKRIQEYFPNKSRSDQPIPEPWKSSRFPEQFHYGSV